MPSFKNFLLNLISIALPLAVSGYVFNELVSSQTEMQNKMNSVLSYSTNTETEKKINEARILEKLVESMLKVSESGKSIFFDKLVLTGTDKPSSFKIEEDQGYIWMNSGKTKLFLSAYGKDKVEILTDRFFNRDLTFKKDLEVLRNLEVSGEGSFKGGMSVEGNVSAETITLSSAYLTESLKVAGNLEANSLTLSTAYISGDVTVLGNIAVNSANFTNLNAVTFSGTSGFMTNFGITSNFSAANVGITTLFSVPTGNFTTRLGVNGDFSAGASSLGSTSVLGSLSASTISTNNIKFNNNSFVFSDGNDLFISNPTKNVYIGAGQSRDVFLYSGQTEVASFGSTIDLNATTYIRGDLILSNPSGTSIMDFFANGASGNNIMMRSNLGSTVLAQINQDFTNTLEIENLASGGNTHFNFPNGGNQRTYISDNLEMELTSSETTFNNNLFVNGTGRITTSTAVTDNAYVCTATSTGQLEFKTAACTTSSQRYKENITSLPYSIADIMDLRPVIFNYKDWDDSNPGGRTKERIGFIAEEVNEVIPEVVYKENGVIESLDYPNLISLLTKGIQEQQVQINSLSQAIAIINVPNIENLTSQLMTTLENLSMSTEDGALIVNTNLTVTGEALFNNAAFTGNVEIGQVKIDSLENDISIKAASCVDMDGNMNQESCDSNKLSLMQNKAGNVEMFDGKVKFKPNGEVLGEKVQAKTFNNTPSSAPEADASCNAGEFKFAEDGGKVYVFFCSESVGWVRSELSKY